jgi:hypothetical protein
VSTRCCLPCLQLGDCGGHLAHQRLAPPSCRKRAPASLRVARPLRTNSRRPARECPFPTRAVVPTPTADEACTCGSDEKQQCACADGGRAGAHGCSAWNSTAPVALLPSAEAGASRRPTVCWRTPATRPFRASCEAEPVRLLYGESGTLRQARAVPDAAAGSPETRWRVARVSRRMGNGDAAGVGCSRVGRHRGSAGRAS